VGRNLSAMRAGLSLGNTVREIITIVLVALFAFVADAAVSPRALTLLYLIAPSARPAWGWCPSGEVVYLMNAKIDAVKWMEITGMVSFLISFAGFLGIGLLIVKRWRSARCR
jgi:hypothetical protein